MNKQAYSRKPRKAYGKLKKILEIESHSEHTDQHKMPDDEFTEAQVENTKSEIRERLKREGQKNRIISIVVFAIVILLILWIIF